MSENHNQAPVPARDDSQIRAFVDLLWVNDGCLELRIIGPKTGDYRTKESFVGFYNDPEALVRDAAKYHAAKAIYVGANPRKSELLHAQAANVLVSGAEGGKNEDICYQQWLLIDIDTVRPNKRVAATDEEIEAARAVYDAVLADLRGHGVTPISAESGNGRHLLAKTIPYDLGPAFVSKVGDFAVLLRWFSRKYSTDMAEVDDCVFDPARVWKFYGTASIKGGNTVDRPWRTAKFDLPAELPDPVDVLEIYKAEILEQRDFEAKENASKRSGAGGGSPAAGSGDLSTLDIARLFKSKDLYVKHMKENMHFVKCPWSGEHSTGTDGDGSTVIFDGVDHRWPGFKCQHSHCSTRALKEVLDWFGPDAVDACCSQRWERRGGEKRSRQTFEFIKLGDLLAREDEVYQWATEGLLIGGGTSIFAGKPKTGKTTLARQLALSIARGASFLGRSCTLGPVIYVAAEEKLEEVKRHFKEMGANGDEEIYVHAASAPHDAIKLLLPEIERLKPKLLVLDTLFRVIQMADGNDYASVTNALEPVQDLARETGVHIMCLHHMGKADREGGDGILGSTAILGAFDTALLLNRKDKTRTIKTIQRYGKDLDETVLGFDDQTRISSLGSPKRESDAEYVAQEILRFLSQVSEAMTEPDIAAGVGGNKQRRGLALRQLSVSGRVLRSGKGGRGDPFKYGINPQWIGKDGPSGNW